MAAVVRNAVRRVVTVARRCRWPTSSMVRTCFSARPRFTRVGSPRITSRKWPARASRALQRRAVSSAVDDPMRAANTGSNGRVSSTTTALNRSTQARASQTITGTAPAATSEGRKFATYGSTWPTPAVSCVLERPGPPASQRAARASRSSPATRAPATAERWCTHPASRPRTASSAATARAGASNEVTLPASDPVDREEGTTNGPSWPRVGSGSSGRPAGGVGRPVRVA